MALELSPNNRRYGVKTLTPDHRDYGMYSFLLSARRPLITSLLPSLISYRDFCPRVRDQASLGSCTAHAADCMRGFLYRKYFDYELHKDFPSNQADFSTLYFYYRERELEGTLPEDSGAEMRTICKTMVKFGICWESQDAYNPANFNVPPTPDQTAQAYNLHLSAYHRLSTVADMRACLASGYVFVLGFPVYESFESDKVARTGIMPVPKSDEALLGGHAICVIGYDDSRQLFEVRNSWGDNWGDKGNFWMPYSVADSAAPTMGAYVMHLGKPWKG